MSSMKNNEKLALLLQIYHSPNNLIKNHPQSYTSKDNSKPPLQLQINKAKEDPLDAAL